MDLKPRKLEFSTWELQTLDEVSNILTGPPNYHAAFLDRVVGYAEKFLIDLLFRLLSRF